MIRGIRPSHWRQPSVARGLMGCFKPTTINRSNYRDGAPAKPHHDDRPQAVTKLSRASKRALQNKRAHDVEKLGDNSQAAHTVGHVSAPPAGFSPSSDALRLHTVKAAVKRFQIASTDADVNFAARELRCHIRVGA